MGYDIHVEFKNWPKNVSRQTTASAKELGLSLELHPKFTPESDSGWLPIALKVTSKFPFRKHLELAPSDGKIETGFEYYGGPAGCTLVGKDGNFAAIVVASIWASLADGKLSDPQLAIEASGVTPRDIISELLKNTSFYMSGPYEVIPFEVWEDGHRYVSINKIARWSFENRHDWFIQNSLNPDEIQNALKFHYSRKRPLFEFEIFHGRLRELWSQGREDLILALVNNLSQEDLIRHLQHAAYSLGVPAIQYMSFLLKKGTIPILSPERVQSLYSYAADSEMKEVLSEYQSRGGQTL
jgi:hypothetical protein